MSRKASVIGPYRIHNFGDDLIGAVIASELKAQGYAPSVLGLGQENCDYLGIACANNKLSSILESSLIVIGGGGILGRSGVRSTEEYRLLAAKAALLSRLLGKRVVISGVGAGPLELTKSRALVRLACALASKVGVRDQESEQFLVSLGVRPGKIRCGADLALLLEDKLVIERKPQALLGFQFDIDSFGQELASTNASALRLGLQQLISSHPDDKALISNGRRSSQLLSGCRGEVTEIRYSHLGRFLSDLSGCRAVLTSHLHIAIAAYAMRIPCFSLYVREKNQRFFRQIGRPDRAVSLQRATAADLERLLAEMQSASWTPYDESHLLDLKGNAQSLLDLLTSDSEGRAAKSIAGAVET